MLTLTHRYRIYPNTTQEQQLPIVDGNLSWCI
ncbi:helix-turn-helix domain-containing protein [Lyngbya sp. PCC 8106]|nr:helix-turn-helix domain-containing protein [Lyngbya sp. PCC 8106]